MDFESLYTNIEINDALTTLTEFMSNKLDKKHITPKGFYNLLFLILNFNYFIFMKKTNKKTLFFKQIKGVAMGTIVGPSVANIYILILESKWSNIY